MLPAGYRARALASLEATGAANVGAIQKPVGLTAAERGIAAAMRSLLGSGGAAYRSGGELRRVDTAFLGVYRVDALRAVGGWDEAFERNEDAELNFRLNQADHQVWLDPQLVVEYRPRSSLRALASQYFHYGWWRRRTMAKHPQSISWRQLAAPGLFVGLASSAVVGALIWPVAYAVPAAYVASCAATAVAAGGSVRERAFTAAALPTMHLSWALGFFVSVKRKGHESTAGRISVVASPQ